MERTAPPWRRIPSVGDAVSFFAAILGLVLLVATARHLFWSDSVAVAPHDVAPLAQVAPAAAPVARKRVDSEPAARAQRARPVSGMRHDVARHDTLRHDVARSEVDRHDVARHNVAQRGIVRHDAPRQGAPAHPLARQVSAQHSQPAQRSQPIVQRSEQHPQKIARRIDALFRPIVHPVVGHARPNAHVAQRHPQLRSVRTAAVSPRTRASPPSPHRSAAPSAQRRPTRTAFVAARAERRARARQATIIEPPLGFQTHVTLVELPAALGLDLGRDPAPALQIRRKHRH